jgi:hypothetical protein
MSVNGEKAYTLFEITFYSFYTNLRRLHSGACRDSARKQIQKVPNDN